MNTKKYKMVLRKSLNQTLNLKIISNIVNSILENPSEFEILFKLMSDRNVKISWRAAWVCDKIAEIQPLFFCQSHIDDIVSRTISNSHEGFRRSCLSILYHLPLQPVNVPLLNSCFEWMISRESSIAIQALSIKIIHRYCIIEPDIKHELKAYLENYETERVSVGILALRKKILKTL